MADFADDASSELERKARALRVVAVVETVSFALLLAAMAAGNEGLVRVVGAIHGQLFLLFAIMVAAIRKPMSWTWRYVALVVLTGPVGPLLVYERLRREPVPDVVLRDPRFARSR